MKKDFNRLEKFEVEVIRDASGITITNSNSKVLYDIYKDVIYNCFNH